MTITSNLWLYRIISCSHPSVLCFRRPLNSGLFPGDPSSLLILWLPTLLCFHLDHHLVVTSNVWFILGPSYFHSSNLCVYPTIHSSSHLIYICIRTFPSASSPVGVFTRAISSTYLVYFVFGPSSLCSHSLLCVWTHMFFPYARDCCRTIIYTTTLCLYLYSSLFIGCVRTSNVDFRFLSFNTDHTLYSVFLSGSSTILFSGNDLVWWRFISGSSRLQLLYSVFSRIIASSSPLLFVLNGPSHLRHIYLLLLYRESPRSSIMHFYPDHSLFSLYSRSVLASGSSLLGPLFSSSGISLLCPLYHY